MNNQPVIHIPGPIHEERVRRLCERDGWQTGNFLHALSQHMRGKLWKTDGDDGGFPVNRWVVPRVREMRFRPDAFRFRVEGPPRWNWSVLAVEVIEVVYANPVSQEKRAKYRALYEAFDYSDRLHFRAFWTLNADWIYVLEAEDSVSDWRAAA
jgi:hypothetical protein